MFLAGSEEGNFVVTVSCRGISATAQVVVSSEDKPQGALPFTQQGSGKLSWVGEVPAQKWMNFYTRVLSRFAAGKGLRLTVNVEITPEGGVSSQQVEETKMALTELGLGDEVTLK